MEVESYDPYTDAWTPGSPALKYVSNFSAAGCGGRLYLVGSRACKYTPLALQSYNPITGGGTAATPPDVGLGASGGRGGPGDGGGGQGAGSHRPLTHGHSPSRGGRGSGGGQGPRGQGTRPGGRVPGAGDGEPICGSRSCLAVTSAWNRPQGPGAGAQACKSWWTPALAPGSVPGLGSRGGSPWLGGLPALSLPPLPLSPSGW